MSIIDHVIASNTLICLYIMVLYYLLTHTRTISLTEYLYYFLIGVFVIVPITGYLQYQIFFDFLSSPLFAGTYLGPLEELTKILIPVLAIHLHPKRKSMSVADFILIAIAVGCAFSLCENLLYSRSAFAGGKFNILAGSKMYMEYNFQSITYFNHFLYPAAISAFLGLKNRFSKSIVLSILFYILSVITLAYSMFVHGFYNYCQENSVFGIIQYPENKLAVFIYEKICFSGRYLDIIFIALVICIAIFEAISLYKASKQPGSLLSHYFSNSYQKQIIIYILKSKRLKQTAFNPLYKKYLFYSLFAGIDKANTKYGSLIELQALKQQSLFSKTEVHM